MVFLYLTTEHTIANCVIIFNNRINWKGDINMLWLENNNWNKKHTNKEIYLMVNHKWAFAVWESARISQLINENALLVHVDSHLDDLPQLVEDERYFKAQSENDILYLVKFERSEEDDKNFSTNYELNNANFIFPAFLRNTIQDIIYVSDYKLEEITVDDIYKVANRIDESAERIDDITYITYKMCYEKIKEKNKSIQRYLNVEDFLIAVDQFPIDQPKILDLDLDYFNDSDNFLYSDLKSDDVIRDNLRQLKNLCEWDIITVALSPGHCGGKGECLHILDLFLDVFELDFSDFADWR